MTFPAVFYVTSLNGRNGFAINGINSTILPYSGAPVSGAGDINGDGISDIIIGVLGVNPDVNAKSGQSYVVFGSSARWPAVFNASSLDGHNGFIINGFHGALPNSQADPGLSVSGAGDVNGDGIADILIGAPNARNFAGQSYVVFGSRNAWPATVNVSNLDGSNGFALNGIHSGTIITGDKSGLSVSGAGDVNSDGISDILIGAPAASNYAGQSYLIFGSRNAWPAVVSLGNLNGDNGFAINGVNAYTASGWSVSGAGDVNDDGIADILIGAPGGANGAGQSYLIFGSSARWSAVFNASSLNGRNGFAVSGINASGMGDSCGNAVSGAGDVNGDGIDDILIGAPNARNFAGQSYVVFGSRNAWPATINASSLNGRNGFAVNGIYGGEYGDASGWSVSGAGDINGDRVADILIGAPGASYFTGQSYVVFGSNDRWPANVNASSLNGHNGFVVDGPNIYADCGGSLSGAGDINADGISDILIGAPGVNNGIGQSYLR